MASKVKNWWKPPALRIDEDSETERHATWLELFYDLIFVVAISELAHDLNQDISPSGFLSFVILFVPIWWSWVSATLYSTRFDTDDPLHRLLTGIQMFAVAALAVNVNHGLGESSDGFALSYTLIRTVNVIEYQRARRHVPVARRLTVRFIQSSSIVAGTWLVSAFVPIPLRFILWALALTVDFLTPLLVGQLSVKFAPHTSHLPERFGLFILIVLGESVMGVVNGVAQQQWSVSLAFFLALGLIIAFSLWWIYFDNLGGSAIESARACRHRLWAYRLWLYMHLPLAIGLTATGVGIERTISHASSLVLPSAERWLICSAVALCLLALGIIYSAGLIANRELHGKIRVAYRFGAAAFVMILALVGTELSPIILIGLIAIVCATQIILELRDGIAFL